VALDPRDNEACILPGICVGVSIVQALLVWRAAAAIVAYDAARKLESPGRDVEMAALAGLP
jgi:hypothetical protein